MMSRCHNVIYPHNAFPGFFLSGTFSIRSPTEIHNINNNIIFNVTNVSLNGSAVKWGTRAESLRKVINHRRVQLFNNWVICSLQSLVRGQVTCLLDWDKVQETAFIREVYSGNCGED